MKRLAALSILLLVLASAVYADHSLVGTWLFKSKIGNNWFVDYVAITSVSTSTRQVKGHHVLCPESKITGYYFSGACFIESYGPDFYVNGWYFSFQPGSKFAKHYGVVGDSTHYATSWHTMIAKRLPDSSVAPKADPAAYLRAQMLKALADQAARNVIPSNEK